MSYQSQSQLEIDPNFQGRTRAVAIQQANTFKDDQRPNWKATANGVLRNDPGLLGCFNRLAAAAPGIGDKVEQPNGEIDQSLVTDGDLLSITQAAWPIVSDLYFNTDGTPLQG